MANNLGIRGPLLDIEIRLAIAAHHEAGHIVIAAALGLPLRSEGIMVDTDAEGLACYCKEPEESDHSRERVMLATFAGCYAQNRFCGANGYPALEDPARIGSGDWYEARRISIKLSDGYLADQGIKAAHESIERQSETLVAERWPIIGTVAKALLAKDWEPVKPLKSGGRWASGELAKYLIGDEVVNIVARLGITATCVQDC
jgi:hypothetical protein